MVSPIRELGNITLSAITTSSNTSDMASSQDINMVVDLLDNLFDIGNNYDEVRDHSLEMSIHKLRSFSILLSKCDKEYHICVKRESDRMDKDEPVKFKNSGLSFFFIFFLIFNFLFNLFFNFQFLESKVRVRVTIGHAVIHQSYHMTWSQ